MVYDFLKNRSGNFSAILALSLTALIAAAGMTVDLTNQMRTQSDLQNTVDMATMAGATLAFAGGSDGLVKQEVKKRFAGQCGTVNCDLKGLNIQLSATELVVSTTQATPTLFMAMFGRDTLGINAKASVKFGSGKSVDVYFLLDNTGSMNIVDGEAAIEKFKPLFYPFQNGGGGDPSVQCAFACHLTTNATGHPVTYNGLTGAEIARANKIPMREDRIRSEMVDQAKILLTSSPNLRISVNSFSSKLTNHLGATKNFSKVKGAIEGIVNQSEQTNYDMMSNDIDGIVGKSGSGLAASPKKIMVMITDGAQQHIKNHWPEIINQSACDLMKSNGRELYVLNIAYPDAKKIAGHQFEGAPEYEMIKIAPNLEPALQKCASKPENYFRADYGVSIDKALQSISDKIIADGKGGLYFTY